MARRKRVYRSGWLLVPALLASATAQSTAFITYDQTRPEPVPHLTIRLLGEGSGQILVTKVGDPTPLMRCSPKEDPLAAIEDTTGVIRIAAVADHIRVLMGRLHEPKRTTLLAEGPRCSIEVPAGTQVRLSAVLQDQATFAGYRQHPMRTPKELQRFLGDPLASCMHDDVMAAAAAGDALECMLTVTTDTDVAADFGLQPKQIDVAFANDEKIEALIKPIEPTPPPAPIDAEKLEDKPLEVAIVQPPKVTPPPPITPPPPPPPPPEAKKQEPPPTPPPNMVMVEVKDDKNVKDKAPDDAKQLSDKNRDVAEETRATETNLDKESEGKTVASRENDDTKSMEVGGPEDKIRQLEETEPTTDERIRETDHSGNDEVAKGVIVGEAGDKGDDGTGPKEQGVLAMRGIGGRGAIQDLGDGKKIGKKGTPGINTPLSFQDYERLMGKEKVDDERQVAARKMSSKKGRWERKLDAVKSSLENFVPDVRPGNQTALKTRAHPYALYVARMHRRIHELWGFGFLEQLDDKAADYPLNNPDLWTNLEISVNPDGTLHKVTIVKTSGKTEFDVAAIDTVLSSAPFEKTPEAIRSVDDRIYLRWGFYRNWRQCGTFNVEPYILTEVPDDGGVGVLDDGAMVKNVSKLPGSKKRQIEQPGKAVTPDDGRGNDKVSPVSTVTDKEALFAANLWVSAFATASVDKLVKYSTVPFYAGGKVAAETTADLKEMYSGLVVESGPMKDWKLLTPAEYSSGSGALPEGNLVLQVRTAKEAFAVVLTRTKSGDYRATQLAR
ncbi:MAG: energy transducer TonB [Deltaproteobacteria bacterium]|nr:energy transducer TonB [Deltaproteobacteria bacterium]